MVSAQERLAILETRMDSIERTLVRTNKILLIIATGLVGNIGALAVW